MTPLDQPLEQPELQRPMGDMPFLDHIEELRRRLLKALLAVIALAGASFYFSDEIVTWFIAPLGGVKLHVTEVTGSFSAYLKISLITGIIAGLPIIFYQLWAFVAPGLYEREKRWVIPFVMIATLLFLCGAGFCYYFVLPFALAFLIGFSGDLLSPIITVSSYISFASMLLLAFGFSFEMPVIAFLLGKLGVISSAFLARGRRIAIVLILVASAVLTPSPDVVTQLMLAVPMYLLYETSIVVVRMTGRRR